MTFDTFGIYQVISVADLKRTENKDRCEVALYLAITEDTPSPEAS